jgi:hypothetical protein
MFSYYRYNCCYNYCVHPTPTTTTTTTNNNNNNKYFSVKVTEKGKKHWQPTMVHHPMLSLLSEHEVLISRTILHCNVSLCTAICNTNNDKI